MESIRQEIESRLKKIEQEEKVSILYACESGSRAWGFPSADSDYDVRFIYVHPQDWYLSIDDKRDVIERKISDLIDISGWDIRKALKLLQKSNPPLLEWLNSSIIYKQRSDIVDKIKLLMPEYYSPKSCLYHYLHMAERNFREYLKGEIVWVKKYFYVLRPVLACKWIVSGYGVVPMEFEQLINKLLEDAELKAVIGELLRRKKEGQELDGEPKIPVISDFIEAEIEKLKKSNFADNKIYSDTEKLNDTFRSILVDAW